MSIADRWPALAILTFVAVPASAGFRQEAVHEHGTARVEIAIEGAVLELAFDAPAINVIGYEHAPRTPEERRSLTQAEGTFARGAQLFGFPRSAQCTLKSAERKPIVFEKDGDDENAAGARHADFSVAYHFECEHPEALAWMDVNLFPALKNAQKIMVTVVSRQVQLQIELGAAQTRVPLTSAGQTGQWRHGMFPDAAFRAPESYPSRHES